MKTILIPVVAIVPFLLGSCGKKETPGGASTEASSETAKAGEGVILAKKNHIPAIGTSSTSESTMKMGEATVNIKAAGQDISGTAVQNGAGKETVEVLAAEKVRVLVVNKSSSGTMTIAGQDQPTPSKEDPLQGVPVILEKKDGKWTVGLEAGGTATAEQQQALDKMTEKFEEDSDFHTYGEAPRKPGDKWDVDLTKLRSFGGADEVSGTYQVEFTGVEDHEGTRCAVLKSVVDIKGKTEAAGGAPAMDMQIKGEVTTKRSIGDLIDLDVHMKGTMFIKGEPAPNVDMEMEGPLEITEKKSVKRP